MLLFAHLLIVTGLGHDQHLQVTDLTEQVRRSTFTGTVTHSPPEMLQGDPNPDYAYDVYAFGILMYEMCSLTPVYAGLSDRQVAQQVCGGLDIDRCIRAFVIAEGLYYAWCHIVA